MKTTIWLLTAFVSLPPSATGALVLAQTIVGEALCARCELKQTEKCQTAIREKADDAQSIYFTADNHLAQRLLPNVCKEAVKVTAIGAVRERKGQRQIILKDVWLGKP